MMKIEKVVVLLSTYNGEKFLRQQLDSVLGQKGVEVSVFVRDDGSSDNTIDILKEYEKKASVKWYKGNNIGYAKSFWKLIRSSEDAEYFAFCDQDDIWDEDKLYCAIDMIKNNFKNLNTPILYFSDVRVTDCELHLIQDHMVDRIKATYAHSLMKNIAPGCTYVFNKAAKKILEEYDVEKFGIDIHDWQVYRIVSCFGQVIFDKTSHMNYRQHSNNQIGAKNVGIKEYKDALYRLKNKKNVNCRQEYAKRMLEAYGNLMSEENFQITKRMATYRGGIREKVQLLFDRRFNLEGIKGIYFKLLVLTGRV